MLIIMSKDTSRENRKYGLPLVYAGISCIVLSIILIIMIKKLKKRKLMKHKTYINGLGSAGIIGLIGVYSLIYGLVAHFGKAGSSSRTSSVHPNYRRRLR